MTVTSVERAFALLRAIPETDATLTGLSRSTGLPVATVSRLMGTMEELGAVTRDGKAYRLGPVVGELAGQRSASADLASSAKPHLRALAAATDETAGVAGLTGNELLHMAQVSSDHDVEVKDWTGFQVALHSGCIGLVMMAYLADDEIDRYLSGELERFSDRTVIEPDAVRRRLARVRRVGWLWTTDEYAIGVTTVAAPVFDGSDGVVGSLYCHGPSYRFPVSGDRNRIGRLVADRAESVGRALGWRGVR